MASENQAQEHGTCSEDPMHIYAAHMRSINVSVRGDKFRCLPNNAGHDHAHIWLRKQMNKPHHINNDNKHIMTDVISG